MSAPDELQHIDEFTADEWFDVMRACKPDITREEFDRHWAEFAEMKAAGAFGVGRV